MCSDPTIAHDDSNLVTKVGGGVWGVHTAITAGLFGVLMRVCPEL